MPARTARWLRRYAEEDLRAAETLLQEKPKMRIFCALSVILFVFSCATDPPAKTFKEKYDVYAELPRNETPGELPFPNLSESTIEHGLHLTRCDIPIDELEVFADAIVRCMDAKTLSEYLEIQDQIDTDYLRLRESPSTVRADEKRGTLTRHGGTYERYVKNLLFEYYMLRDEASIRDMVVTVQYTRYISE